MFCSAVTGCRSASTKLLFIYLKTCIPWKKMPQDSTVFLKLNPAGWSGEQATEHSCAPTSSGNRVPHVLDSPTLAEQQESLAKMPPVSSAMREAALWEVRPSALLNSRSATASHGRGSGFKSSDGPSCPNSSAKAPTLLQDSRHLTMCLTQV